MSRNTQAIMTTLREIASHRRGHRRINEWVDGLLAGKEEAGESVTILTQMCVAQQSWVRWRTGNGTFAATKGGRDLFERDIPLVRTIFTERGLTVEWYLTLHLPFPDPGRERVTEKVFPAFRAFIEELAKPLVDEGWLLICNWEQEILGKRPQPSAEFLANPNSVVPDEQIQKRIQFTLENAPANVRTPEREAEQRRWMPYIMGCEAEEGRWLSSGDSPFGNSFLVAPLEPAGKTLSHGADYNRRMIDVLPHSPWLP